MPRVPHVLHLACGLATAAATAWFTVPGFTGWYHNDDLKNLRWVLEYRSEPWKALTELHAVHDHVRPMTLLATWAGALLSDGEWWGPHLVLVALFLALVAGAGFLAWRRSGSLWAPWMVGALALTLGGTGPILSWNAYTNTAGELAAGFWALGVATFIRSPGRAWLLAPTALLLVLSGLFKEPGWVVYPVAAAALVIPVAGRRTALLSGLLPLLGLGGLWLTWHPSNLGRYAEQDAGLWSRAAENLARFTEGLVGRWPMEPRMFLGIGALVVSTFLFRGLLLGSRAGDGGWRSWWFVPALPMAAAWYLWPQAVAWTLYPLVAGVLIRRWREPPVELLLVLLSVAVMAPNPGTGPVHAASGGLGLAVYCAVQAVEWARSLPSSRGWRRAGGLVLGATMAILAAGQLFLVLSSPPKGRIDYAFRDSTWSMASFVQTTRATALRLGLPRSPEGLAASSPTPLLNTFWPLYREEIIQDRSLPDAVTVWVDGLVALLPASVSQDLEPRRLPLPDGGTVDLERGYYAVGLLAGAAGSLAVKDGCQRTWTVQPPDASAWASFRTLKVDTGCGPLTFAWTDPGKAAPGSALLFRLQDPELRLPSTSLPPDQRTLTVRSRGVSRDIVAPEGRAPAPLQ